MLDVVLESLKILVLLAILVVFVRADKDVALERRGWLYIKLGFLLLLFGSILDVTDNFESLNDMVFIGPTPGESFLEKFIGYLFGFILLAAGFWKWLPSMHTMEETQKILEKERKDLETAVVERTHALERESALRRRAEVGQLLAEERRIALFEQSPMAVCHGIIGGSLVERNMAYIRMLGYDSQEELAMRALEAGNPFHFWPYKEEVETMLQRLRSEEHISDFEARLQKKDGSIIWVRLDFTTLKDRDGKNYYFYCFAEDITERKSEMEALSESVNRLKTIMEALPAGLYLVDAETRRIMEVNNAMLSMTGFSRDELLDQNCCESLCRNDEGVCAIDGMDKQAFVEGRVECKDGSLLPVIKTASKLDLDGTVYVLEAAVDMSEQKRLEEMKKDVDRIVAHDLKAPILGLMNASRILLMDGEQLNADAREMLEYILGQANKVLRMVGMSRTIYSMEAGTYDYIPEEVDFLKVVNVVIRELDDMARSKGTTVTVLADGREPADDESMIVAGSRMLYESMLANLLSNAIEGAPFGGSVQVELISGDSPQLRIINDGAVPEDVRNRFFEKYATSGKTGGTGLGTYSASLAVRTVGGTIDMDTSDEEDRTTVTVRFPVQ